MKAAPLVSVVVPTCGQAAPVARAITGALAQTHPRVEVVVVDHGSTDATIDLLREQWGGDPRVRLARRESRGLAAARNYGILLASGDLVAFLDPCDEWLPWKAEAQTACLVRFPEAGMVWSDFVAVGADDALLPGVSLRRVYRAYAGVTLGEVFARSVALGEIAPGVDDAADARVWVGDLLAPMLAGNLIPTATAMLTRETLDQVGGFDESLDEAGGDFDFHLRTCRRGPVIFLDASTIRHRVGAPDQRAGPDHRVHLAAGFLATLEKASDWADDPRVPGGVLERSLAHAHARLGEELLEARRSREARLHLWRSVRLRLTPRLLGLWALAWLPGPVVGCLQAACRRCRRALSRC